MCLSEFDWAIGLFALGAVIVLAVIIANRWRGSMPKVEPGSDPCCSVLGTTHEVGFGTAAKLGVTRL